MPIKEIHLEEMPQLGAPISFRCDERVNLFIGPNASGKTSILQAVFAAPFRQSQEDGDVLIQETRSNLRGTHFNSSSAVSKGDSLLVEGDYRIPRYYIPATRVSLHRDANLLPSLTLPPEPIFSDEMEAEYASLHDLVTDAIQGRTTFQQFQRTVTRLTLSYSMSKLFDTGQGVFYGRDLEVAVDWLKRLSASDEPMRAQYEKALQLGYSCVKDVCRDVIEDEAPYEITVTAAPEPVNEESEEFDEFEDPEDLDPEEAYWREVDQQPRTRPAIGIGTSDNPGDEPLYLGYLSSGTQATLLWVWSFAFRMLVGHHFHEGWEGEPAILLVDEIENHLHPTWQRRIIPALLRHFPRVQIFATTHSPFVVAGLKRGQIHRLYREHGIVKTPQVDEEEKDHYLLGWTADLILRDFMDVVDPTDEFTAEAAAVNRWLGQQRPFGGPADEWKDHLISELTTKPEPTDDEKAARAWLEKQEDLSGDAQGWWEEAVRQLAYIAGPNSEPGGPLAAQRKLFISELEEILHGEWAVRDEGEEV